MKIETTRLPFIQPERNQESPVIKQLKNQGEIFQRTLKKETQQDQSSQSIPSEAVISKTEKKTFEDLFPQAVSQVRAYQSPVYQPKSQTIMLGRIIDRRG